MSNPFVDPDKSGIEYIKIPGDQRRYDVQGYIDSQTESDITAVCYCRVSGKSQTDVLESQVESMRSKFPTAAIIKDYGSGINFKPKGLQTLLECVM